MTKKFYSLASILLTSLIALLGFGSCKTPKQVINEPVTPPPMSAADSIQLEDYKRLMNQEVKPSEPMKLLYGAPPVKRVSK